MKQLEFYKYLNNQTEMKKANLRFLVVLFGLLAISITSCTKDDENPVAPVLTAPSVSTVVEEGMTTDISFNVTIPGGFASASVTALNGTAVVSSTPSVGATSGTVEVTFSAENGTGAGSVTLIVTDQSQQTDDATAVVSIEAELMQFTVSANISENTTWETGKTYILDNRIFVLNGVTLTIEPGVVVKGAAGSDVNATALIIAQGGKIMAEGTATQPIIFTSVADEIEPGQIASPNLGPTLNGLWGGLIVLGKAHISYQDDQGNDSQTASIEGIPPDDANGIYGGTDDADNSGVLKYISIRHGGANIGEGNEINGLTLGGVGSGTVIENIEIISNQDDGIEWFGGTVTVKNVVVWNTGDDAIDTDQAFAGTVDNIVIINPGDECFELDGPEGSYLNGAHTLKNITASVKDASGLIDFDANTNVTIENALFENITVDTQDVEEYDKYFAAGNFASSNWEVILPTDYTVPDVFKGGSDAITTSVTSETKTVGADLTKFATWSWASVAGELTGL
ncbi:MAG: hypothetical protein JW729_02525 [Bacteroidales bacterium]|nr:hypothetical protein [Bacteroidales bacterium]